MGELDFVPSKPRHLPTVYRLPVQTILNNTELPRNKVIFSLLYGAGLRITECLQLRVKDIDFNLGCIQVQDGKGNKHRTTLLPTKLIPELQILIQQTIEIQRKDNAQGVGPLAFCFR